VQYVVVPGLAVALLLALSWVRAWLHDGRGRWATMRRPDNVIYLSEYLENSGQ
jgi:hypothetical protein